MLDSHLTPSPDQVLKVTSLTRLIKNQLEGNFSRLWVQGEVSNLRRQSSGHVYFSLKDAGSQLPCVLFARDAAQQSFQLQDGMEVILLGDISVYEPHGRYQLIAKIAIEHGEGRLQVEFERLKRKLAAEGLFDRERKQALPMLPRKVAVVTSPTGAAIRDFLRILKRRQFLGEVVIFPAKVQGAGAATEIASMLRHACASGGFDLIVITRGGGSIEDLWAFNEEPLARAVAECSLPVISAIGHEIDTVLTDYAADKRAETPSGAAELISSLYLEARSRYEDARNDLTAWVDSYIADYKTQLRDLDARMQIIAPERQVQHLGMRLDELENKLSQKLQVRIRSEQDRLNQLAHRLTQQHPKTQLSIAQQRLADTTRRLQTAQNSALKSKSDTVSNLEHRLKNGSLEATLRRGYAILQSRDGKILERAAQAADEEVITAKFIDGEIDLKT